VLYYITCIGRDWHIIRITLSGWASPKIKRGFSWQKRNMSVPLVSHNCLGLQNLHISSRHFMTMEVTIGIVGCFFFFLFLPKANQWRWIICLSFIIIIKKESNVFLLLMMAPKFLVVRNKVNNLILNEDIVI
jgi:hypothetical protein